MRVGLTFRRFARGRVVGSLLGVRLATRPSLVSSEPTEDSLVSFGACGEG